MPDIYALALGCACLCYNLYIYNIYKYIYQSIAMSALREIKHKACTKMLIAHEAKVGVLYIHFKATLSGLCISHIAQAR